METTTRVEMETIMMVATKVEKAEAEKGKNNLNKIQNIKNRKHELTVFFTNKFLIIFRLPFLN